MPSKGKRQSQDRQEGRKGGKEGRDLCSLAGGDHIGGQVLEYALELVRRGSFIVFAAGRFCDLAQGDVVDLPAEAAALSEAKAKPTAVEGDFLELGATIHEGVIAVGAETDRIDPDTAFHGL